MWIFALFLAALAGIAAEKGSICAVSAVRDLFDRRPARYLAFLECALWSLAVIAVARAVGMTPSAMPNDFPPGLGALAGGALFGLGAAINGGCTFGSAVRLGRGNLAFAAMPAGFLAGVAMLSHAVAAPAPLAAAREAAPAVVVAMLALFVAFQIFRIRNNMAGPGFLSAALLRRDWPPSLAMAAIGLISGALMVLFASWPYSALLVDLAVSATSEHMALKVAMAIAFLAGAAFAARMSGAFSLRIPTLRAVAEKAAGGALMGAGSYLAPGGNDSMVLVGLPHLFLYAAIAYAAMSATIALTVAAGRMKG